MEHRVKQALDDLSSAEESVAIELRRADRLRREAEEDCASLFVALYELMGELSDPPLIDIDIATWNAAGKALDEHRARIAKRGETAGV